MSTTRCEQAKRALTFLILCLGACDPTTNASGANKAEDTAAGQIEAGPVAPSPPAASTTNAPDGAAPAPSAATTTPQPITTPAPVASQASPPAPVVPQAPAPAAGTTTPVATASAAPPAPAPSPAPAPPVTTTRLRGTNLVGMEGGYGFDQATGPVPDVDYAVHATQVVDYLAKKNVNVLRFLFSWERMQSVLGGPIPAATSGNYKAYFDDYKRIVDYATNIKGMTVIMEPWQPSASGGVGGASWRGNKVGGGTVTTAHFADFWTKMAAPYTSNPRVAIGLVNEPNGIDTMAWFATAQVVVTALRSAGFAGDIHVPGNGYTSASGWSNAWYDVGSPQRSNAYGWLNARGSGKPLSDPLSKLVVSVHTYADADASGNTATVVSSTISRTDVTGVTQWARANGLRVFVGEIGMYAGATNAAANWADFVSYLDANGDTLVGFTWWACGKPGWWDDVAASGGGHFSITPTSNYTTDTVNMTMIQTAFHP
jgi:endoglucanase